MKQFIWYYKRIEFYAILLCSNVSSSYAVETIFVNSIFSITSGVKFYFFVYKPNMQYTVCVFAAEFYKVYEICFFTLYNPEVVESFS